MTLVKEEATPETQEVVDHIWHVLRTGVDENNMPQVMAAMLQMVGGSLATSPMTPEERTKFINGNIEIGMQVSQLLQAKGSMN